MHVIHDCPKAKEVWKLIVPIEKQARFFPDPFQIWFTTNLCCHIKLQDKGITWSCLFGLITWRIWKNMNLFIFQNIVWTAYDVLKTSLSWAQHFESFLLETKNETKHLESCQFCSEDWAYLFKDGAVARASGNAAAGGVVRDRYGNWILGFTHYLGRCSPLEAEFWGILDGILIILNKGYKRVKIQTNNLEVVKALNMEENVDSGITLLRRIKRTLQSVGQWEVRHVPKECNLVADHLVKMSLSWQTALQVFEAPPDGVVSVLRQENLFSFF
ncbi:hypothetical protein J1N35_037408 [Gossypium stocksii]|uniref:RNase H type-1 domain-containing protein n=1 Tax=Gossypium stocksii TaxID=47602 RepID=A0A9D3ZLN4_9ROSI|nr:hypothetical protein J1N35_037408 [Gossypium stocksii]